MLIKEQHDEVRKLQGSDPTATVQAVSLLHELWYKWHSSLWDNYLSTATDSEGPLLLHGAMRSRLAVKLVQGPATPIKHHQAKALQLQLLIRHLTRCACLLPAACCLLPAACCLLLVH